jgi:outer membrane murein-binding lipoprotein Lpp
MTVRHVLAAAGLAVLTAGCASQGEVDRIRADVSALKVELNGVSRTASQAAADASAGRACCDRMTTGRK